MPTLIDGGDPIIDSSVINEYLEDVYPEVPVRPRDAKGTARMRAWRQFIDEVPTPAIRYPSFNAYFVPIWQKLSEEEFAAYARRLPLRKHFYRHMGRGGFGKEAIDEAFEKLRQTLERMEKALAKGPWLVGDQYTLADVLYARFARSRAKLLSSQRRRPRMMVPRHHHPSFPQRCAGA